MNRSDYLSDIIIETMKKVTSTAHSQEDKDEYDEASWDRSLEDNALDKEVGNRWDDHRNEYLAACLANASERSGDRFANNPDLIERKVSVYLGKHDRANAIISREYEDDDGETINGHILIDHQHDNNHLEGVQRMSSAYFSFTNSGTDE